MKVYVYHWQDRNYFTHDACVLTDEQKAVEMFVNAVNARDRYLDPQGDPNDVLRVESTIEELRKYGRIHKSSGFATESTTHFSLYARELDEAR